MMPNANDVNNPAWMVAHLGSPGLEDIRGLAEVLDSYNLNRQVGQQAG